MIGEADDRRGQIYEEDPEEKGGGFREQILKIRKIMGKFNKKKFNKNEYQIFNANSDQC